MVVTFMRTICVVNDTLSVTYLYQALPALNTCLSFAVANCSEFSEGKISAKRKSQITIGEKAKVVNSWVKLTKYMMRKL